MKCYFVWYDSRGAPMAVGGTWYPADAQTLGRRSTVFGAAGHQPPERSCVDAPRRPDHRYVAAFAYQQLRGRRFDAIVLVGPSRYVRGRGAYGRGRSRRPSAMPRSASAATAIARAASRVTDVPAAHRREHSLCSSRFSHA
jgi:AmmeMemoRadiSam system protein B